ncbi:hypothetical protein LMH87_002391 [Akanthomyces muscarius]|uniref:Uncharacterized protein n=1 Tax=Akanthomyces muscarius TaxID=2231603 RepID=A0A9W8UJL5_AKAMU|nr:hypothetical protein LMH87_002391 [Akanthomyces muscarius]KAJ4147893.1 hypothetical protein LMH87_002391 [Akanthomyces muscarius]
MEPEDTTALARAGTRGRHETCSIAVTFPCAHIGVSNLPLTRIFFFFRYRSLDSIDSTLPRQTRRTIMAARRRAVSYIGGKRNALLEKMKQWY